MRRSLKIPSIPEVIARLDWHQRYTLTCRFGTRRSLAQIRRRAARGEYQPWEGVYVSDAGGALLLGQFQNDYDGRYYLQWYPEIRCGYGGDTSEVVTLFNLLEVPIPFEFARRTSAIVYLRRPATETVWQILP